jgi:phosphohistidine phosphatase SixA
VRLLVARHGYAGDYSLEPRRERTRRLTVEGRMQVAAVARQLAEWGEHPIAIYASLYERCLETADILGAALGAPVDILGEMCPHMPLGALVDVLRADDGVRRPMLVGHRDNLDPLLEELLGGKQPPLGFAEVRKLKIERDGGKPGRLLWKLDPATALEARSRDREGC